MKFWDSFFDSDAEAADAALFFYLMEEEEREEQLNQTKWAGTDDEIDADDLEDGDFSVLDL